MDTPTRHHQINKRLDIHSGTDSGTDSGSPRAIVIAYRRASRRIRSLDRTEHSPAPTELAGHVAVRERAYNTLMTAGHHDLARVLVEEDAFLLRLKAARIQGSDPAALHTGLRHVLARLRLLLAASDEEGNAVA